MLNLWEHPLSVYIHLPWCIHKCPYCDFNSHATELDQFPETKYVNSLTLDLESHIHEVEDREIQSIFIGGGTPSIFSPDSIGNILITCHELLNITPDCEITLETNPGTFERQKFSEFLSLGINRLSIGAQSFSDASLTVLGRIHDANEATDAIETAHTIGFKNINVDVMFALPKQSIDDALADINHACQLPVNHISYYQLTLEPNTLFHRFPPNLPSKDDCWTMQSNGINQLTNAGYSRYEVSAYSQNHTQCVHNVNYWRFGDYLGIGAGAHSKLSTNNGIVRFQKPRQPDSYLKAVPNNTHIIQQRRLNTHDLIFEFMLNNLRLVEGFSTQSFVDSTGLDWQLIESKISHLAHEGWLDVDHDHIKTTDMGYRFLDDLIERFLPRES